MYPSDLTIDLAIPQIIWAFELLGPGLMALIGAWGVGALIAAFIKGSDD